MPTITVKLDPERAQRLAAWARHRKTSKSEVIRYLIDEHHPIVTGADLLAFAISRAGRGFGFSKREN
jgi:predicted transcriptional regulator